MTRDLYALEQSKSKWNSLRPLADVIKSEATSVSWLARNWRPITMLCFFTVIIFNNYFT